MPTSRNIILPIVLALSVLGNIGLAFVLYVRSTEVALRRDETSARRDERDFLLALVPQLKPRISKSELHLVLRRLHPGEKVNDIGDHIQWRLFQFWFDKRGDLETVRWSS
jgi:hypothetical protein